MRIIGDNSIYLIIVKVLNVLDTGVTMSYHHVIPNRCILASPDHVPEEHGAETPLKTAILRH